MAEPTRKRGVHWAVQVWVFFHLVMITSWSLPDPPKRMADRYLDKREGKQVPPVPAGQVVKDLPNYVLLGNRFWIKDSPTRYYLYSTGFWQYWNMFSPNPANTDVWLDAVVTYQDGTQMVFEYPSMQKLNVFERYFKERFRKFVENTHGDRFSYKWPVIAQAVAYQSYQGDGNLPVMVTLRRHFKTVSPPDQRQDPEYKEYAFFNYMVDTERLLEQARP